MAKNQVNKILKEYLFITGGDPSGIGPEIIRKSLYQLGKNYQNLKIFYIFNSSSEELEKLFTQLMDWQIYVINNKKWSEKEFFLLKDLSIPEKNLLFIYQVGLYNHTYPTQQSGKLSFLALKEAVNLIKLYGCKGLVTAPVSKEWIGKNQPNFSGHTGFLAKEFKTHVLMIMYSNYFSVIPLTEHIPIKKVPKELYKKLQDPQLIKLLKALYNKHIFKKRWAFCGLNPHAGDNGLIGKEEIEFIKPFIEKLKRNRIPIDGPISADTLFIPDRLQNYDLIFACYHDQGLIPFKTLNGKEGINLTFGLPFLRTSPDHGTAFDIAFKEIADFQSMYNAIEIHLKGLWN